MQPGDVVGHYRVLEPLGKGGMGEVFVAEDTRLNRRVALKVLPPVFATDPDSRGRFQREAQAIAALNHPGIVTIHSVEEHDGRPRQGASPGSTTSRSTRHPKTRRCWRRGATSRWKARSSGRSPTCRPNRPKGSRSIRGPTSFRSAWSSTKWPPGPARSQETPTSRSSRRS